MEESDICEWLAYFGGGFILGAYFLNFIVYTGCQCPNFGDPRESPAL